MVRLVTLPSDSHVHSEWSWDAPQGSMERSCAWAVDIGLPAIAFTEHDRHRPAAEVVRQYLAEIASLVTGSDVFSVLAHVDYPVRFWPVQAGRFDPSAFEAEFRHALRATAQSGRALEVNTAMPLHSTVLRRWHEEGGEAITFGSDAHEPSAVARSFRDATDMAEAHGFRPGRNPYDLWIRTN